MKNPYILPIRRAAFDQAIELLKTGLDRHEVSKQLDHSIPRHLRQTIAAKAARMLKDGGPPPRNISTLS